MLHELQDRPQNSLQATPRRLPTEGELRACEQEAEDSIVMAECTNGTLVLLTGEPHEMQNVPQDSLLLTPRPPIEGEPNTCKQEATDGVITAERMKGTVKTAEPTETIADVDEGTMLGRGPVLEACGIDEGDRERNSQLQPQQRNLYDEESRQHDENAIADVPNAYGLPLVGEWEVCASGRLSCESGTSERALASRKHSSNAASNYAWQAATEIAKSSA